MSFPSSRRVPGGTNTERGKSLTKDGAGPSDLNPNCQTETSPRFGHAPTKKSTKCDLYERKRSVFGSNYSFFMGKKKQNS